MLLQHYDNLFIMAMLYRPQQTKDHWCVVISLPVNLTTPSSKYPKPFKAHDQFSIECWNQFCNNKNIALVLSCHTLWLTEKKLVLLSYPISKTKPSMTCSHLFFHTWNWLNVFQVPNGSLHCLCLLWLPWVIYFGFDSPHSIKNHSIKQGFIKSLYSDFI